MQFEYPAEIDYNFTNNSPADADDIHTTQEDE